MLSKAKYLAAASALEFALQFALPIVLTRTLAADEFATYRFLWLVVGTVTGLLLLGLPQSLFYFLPRRDGAGRATVLVQTIVTCTLIGALAAGAIVLASRAPWTADAFTHLPRDTLVFVVILVLLCGSAAHEQVAAAQKEIEAQARINVASSLTRVAAVLVGVWLGGIDTVLWALAVYALARYALQWLYIARRVPLRQARPSTGTLREQVGYALPFGLGTGFWQLRGQAEQWVGAAMLAARDYAALSVAGSMLPVVLLVRRAVTDSIFAELNRLESEGRHAEMLVVNGRANAYSAAVVFPLLGVLFAVASPLIVLVYTPTYAQAALVTQLLIVGAVGGGFIETSSMAKALNLGKQLMWFDGAMLGVSVAMSVAGGWWFGMTGIVIGSVVGRYLSTIFCASIVVRRLGVRWRDFQPWGLLLKTLGASVLAAALGWWVVHRVVQAQPPLLQLAAGAATAAAVYVLLALPLRLPLRPR